MTSCTTSLVILDGPPQRQRQRHLFHGRGERREGHPTRREAVSRCVHRHVEVEKSFPSFMEISILVTRCDKDMQLEVSMAAYGGVVVVQRYGGRLLVAGCLSRSTGDADTAWNRVCVVGMTRGRHFWANRVAIFVGRQRQAARLGDHSVGASKTCLCLHYFCFTHTTLYPVGFSSVNSTRRFHFCCRKYCPELPSCHYIWHFDNGSIFVFIFFREFCQSYRRYVLVCSKQKVFDFFLLVLSSIIL